MVQKSVGSNPATYASKARYILMSVALNSTTLGNYFNKCRGLRVENKAKDPLHPAAPAVRPRTLWDGRTA